MEIDISSFFAEAEPFEFSASAAERGQNAGPETWANAMREAAASPLLTTEDQLDALRDHVRGFGAWSAEEIAAWSADECNALFVQLISGDMREAGFDECEAPDWAQYEADASEGRISGNMFPHEGRIFYTLSR